jgi:hypothetical protein
MWKTLMFVGICAIVFAACERAMTLKVSNDTNPPTFSLSGSGKLIFLVLFEVTPGKQSSVDDPVMWKIRPLREDVVDEIPEITYGAVPPGFTQTVPAMGPPPPLLEGKTYEFGGPTTNAPGGRTRFTIKDGKAVVIASGI